MVFFEILQRFKGHFLNELRVSFKKAVVHPANKKECKTDKLNYRQISILSNLSKIHELLLYDQMYTYFLTFFSVLIRLS